MNRDFDRNFRSVQRTVKAGFFLSFLWVCLVFGTVGYVGYKVLSNPHEVSKTIGETIGAGVKGFKDATN